jgi:hypothetical protein
MDRKYKNIFWHQGIRIFEENFIKTQKGRVRAEHLENDVTKALLNVFNHCSGKPLGIFLQLLGIKAHPESFAFDFQVTDTISYRQKSKKIFLCLVAASTPRISNSSYVVQQSRPDACVYNQNHAILIEAKTQSPLVKEQVEKHIEQYLGTGTVERTVTWEGLSERLKIALKTLSTRDRFLVSQFCEFLQLIGIAEFSGFNQCDFSMLGSIERIPSEEYLDLKRALHKKMEKFMALLEGEIGPQLSHLKFGSRIAKVSGRNRVVWGAFYFHKGDPETHVNEYPNINLSLVESGVELAFNAETKSSVKRLMRIIAKRGEAFKQCMRELDGFSLSIFHKLQYRPMDNFIWNLVPGYPKSVEELESSKIISGITGFEKGWPDVRNTLLYQMKAGMSRPASGGLFAGKEVAFAAKRNSKPVYAIRIAKHYPASLISDKKKKVATFFKREIEKLRKLVELVNA